MAVSAFTQGQTSQRQPSLWVSANGTEILVGALTPAVLLAILASQVCADLYGQLGDLGEQLLQPNRLPQLNIPPSQEGLTDSSS